MVLGLAGKVSLQCPLLFSHVSPLRSQPSQTDSFSAYAFNKMSLLIFSLKFLYYNPFVFFFHVCQVITLLERVTKLTSVSQSVYHLTPFSLSLRPHSARTQVSFDFTPCIVAVLCLAQPKPPTRLPPLSAGHHYWSDSFQKHFTTRKLFKREWIRHTLTSNIYLTILTIIAYQ